MIWRRALLPLFGALLLASCGDSRRVSPAGNDAGGADAETTTPDAGPEALRDASTGMDSGARDGGPSSDAGPLPTLEFDDAGCLTIASARRVCDRPAPACPFLAECGATSESQCHIDCTMATVLCISPGLAETCVSAISSRVCATAETACAGWMHFPL